MRILFTGGGSGGHFFPILAVIRELKRLSEEERIIDLELFYMGPTSPMDDLLKQESVLIIPVVAGKMRRYFSIQNFFDIFKVGIGTIQALWNIFLLMPDVVFSKGGYGAFPAVMGAGIFDIPLIIHESDAVPGKVNLFSVRFAERIGIAFAGAATFFPKDRTAMVGIPIRKRILGGNREEAKESLGLFSTLPVVGFVGASQGAQKVNDAVLEIVKELTEGFEVVHQTGEKNYEQVKGEAGVILEFSHKERYHALAFLDETKMRDFYQACDLIVSRAGASSIFEIAAWGKPSILIPIKGAAQDHQRKGAYEYAATGAAIVIEEDNLTPHILLAEIKKIFGNAEHMKQMGEAAQRFARIDSATVIAKEILKLGVHEIKSGSDITQRL